MVKSSSLLFNDTEFTYSAKSFCALVVFKGIYTLGSERKWVVYHLYEYGMMDSGRVAFSPLFSTNDKIFDLVLQSESRHATRTPSAIS